MYQLFLGYAIYISWKLHVCYSWVMKDLNDWTLSFVLTCNIKEVVNNLVHF